MQCSEMAVSRQILIYPTTSRGFFLLCILSIYEVFQLVASHNRQKLKTIVAITNYAFFRPSDRKLFNNAYNAWENGSMTTQAYKLNSLC